MDGIAAIVEAADSGWALAAIFLIGIYVLLWKFGGEMLRLSRENHDFARENNEVTKKVAKDIVTNHGSKNLGDAIDRLTEWMMSHMEESEKDSAKLDAIEREQAQMSARLGLHLAEHKMEDLNEFTD